MQSFINNGQALLREEDERLSADAAARGISQDAVSISVAAEPEAPDGDIEMGVETPKRHSAMEAALHREVVMKNQIEAQRETMDLEDANAAQQYLLASRVSRGENGRQKQLTELDRLRLSSKVQEQAAKVKTSVEEAFKDIESLESDIDKGMAAADSDKKSLWETAKKECDKVNQTESTPKLKPNFQ